MDKVINITPVILCGGSGSRLWPLSRSSFPKQFITLTDSESLFQKAIKRIKSIKSPNINIKDPLVVTNEEQRFIALEQLNELNYTSAKLLLEPVGRNTAPALTMAAMQAIKDQEDSILVVTPADQIINDSNAFSEALKKSINTAINNNVVILGLVPDGAETGYGYIKYNQNKGNFDEFDVVEFVEKPSKNKAKEYFESKNYLWNSGMFVIGANFWLETIKSLRSDIFQKTYNAFQSMTKDNHFIRPNKKIFVKIPSESIDYAVIENCNSANIPLKVVLLETSWNDLGSWDSLWSFEDKNEKGNVLRGDVIAEDTKNSIIHSSNRLVGVVGLENVAIVETADAVLVANRKNSQGVKDIVANLDSQNRSEGIHHSKVHRPWGWYMTIDEGANFKVKRIQVNPGASLSLQKHSKRAEHWVVVMGTAKVTRGKKEVILEKNESTFIPLGELHRLANPKKIPLEIIEVQSGNYLGEDDIERIDDKYGRENTND